MELKEWLNSINTNKNNLIDEDPDIRKTVSSLHYQQMSIWTGRFSDVCQ